MATNLNIEVSPVSRVEGHGDLVLDVKNKKIEKLQFRIPESPRFFEAMLVGRKYDEPSHITSRICGICSVAHTFTSIKATEAALGVKINDQILKLRKLVNHGEYIQSNCLHVYFLAAPDFLGVGSVIPLIKTNPDVVLIAVKMKKIANEIVRIIGGRAVHPITTVVGGFTKLPTVDDLKSIKNMLASLYPDLETSLKVLKTLKLPDFERETEYISITDKEDYALYDGDLKSSDGWIIKPGKYLEKIKEKVVQHSTGKHCQASRDCYMVGALSRVNNNYEMLSDNAKEYAGQFGLTPPCYNTFMINIAQFVEIVHCVDDSIRLIDEILSDGLDESKKTVPVKPGAGRGVGIVEAPRGTLIHDYTYDRNGRIAKANLIIPTNMNYANIEKDLEAFVPMIIDKTEDEVRFDCEMLLRAYDPCISCSTHFLNVKLINKF
ncbi:MAG: Ni/Fe hydrogenase subunit alpha [Actinobacteria bacterium]|nr:Ni/Fe hydrogenase subunit alpha [Actinomycetota bacterium]